MRTTNTYKMQKGYVGLVMLLVGVAIIAFFIIRTDLFTGNKDGRNIIEKGNDAVGEAENARNVIEVNSKNAVQE